MGPEQLSIDLSHLQEQVSESRVKFTGHLKGSQVHSQVERLRSGLFAGHCFSLSHSHWQSYSLKNGALGGHSAARAAALQKQLQDCPSQSGKEPEHIGLLCDSLQKHEQESLSKSGLSLEQRCLLLSHSQTQDCMFWSGFSGGQIVGLHMHLPVTGSKNGLSGVHSSVFVSQLHEVVLS